MLIGCCHCGPTLDPPSESLPPSESVSSSESIPPSESQSFSQSSVPPEVDYTCNVCEDDISPVRFKLTYSPGGGGCPCPPGTASATPDPDLSRALYSGDFTLHKRSACSWSSDEVAVVAIGHGGLFSNAAKKRFTLSMSTSAGHATVTATVFFGYLGFVGTFNPFTLQYEYPIVCNPSPAISRGDDLASPAFATYKTTFPTAKIDCLSSISLALNAISAGGQGSISAAYVAKLAFGGINVNNWVAAGSGFPPSLTVEAT